MLFFVCYWRILLILERRWSSQGVGVRALCNLLWIHTCTTREENKCNPLLLFLIHVAEGIGSHPHLPSSSHHPANCVAKFHSDLTNTFTKKEDVTRAQSASAQPSICHNSYGKIIPTSRLKTSLSRLYCTMESLNDSALPPLKLFATLPLLENTILLMRQASPS